MNLISQSIELEEISIGKEANVANASPLRKRLRQCFDEFGGPMFFPMQFAFCFLFSGDLNKAEALV